MRSRRFALASITLVIASLGAACDDGATTTTSSSSAGGSQATSSASGLGGGGASACGAHSTLDVTGACVCDPGWDGDGAQCDDVDECAAHLDDCAKAAVCSNTPGSFTCACPTGTVGDPKDVCDSRYDEVRAGGYHTCARRQDGAIFCFGNGGSGRLGNGLVANQSTPVRAGAASNWSALSMGSSHSCGIKDSGTLWCWGLGSSGQLGLGYTDSQVLPAPVSLDTKWKKVAGGDTHTCAIDDAGALWCFGRNNNGQLAQPVATTPTSLVPVQVGANTDWVDVASARDTSCAINAGGELYCWGLNNEGEAGQPIATNPVLAPSLVETAPGAMDSDWASVTVGFTTCGIKTSGALFCWGRAAEGQLANTSVTATPTPTPVLPGTTWSHVSVRAFHACGVQTNGTLSCWGRNTSFQAVPGEPSDLRAATQLGADTDWADVAAGLSHTCARKTDGRVLCWGSRVFGETGEGVDSVPSKPVQIGANDDHGSVATWGDIGCATRPQGTRCWGYNEYGSLGVGDTVARRAPEEAEGNAFVIVAPGRQHVCAIDGAGKIHCAGRNNAAQLGKPASAESASFAPIPTAGKPWGALLFGHLASGENHSCAVSGAQHTLWCWGTNSSGQLSANPSPAGDLVQVVGTTWANVSAGQFHTCASTTDHHLHCFGKNSNGQIGTGATSATSPPTDLGVGFSDAFGAGVNHTCAVKQDGTLWCWGANAGGQLGDGTTVDRLSPNKVGADTDWDVVSAGNVATCATKLNRSLWCWGSNAFGQLGVGDYATRKVPSLVAKGESFLDVRVGFAQTCALREDHTVWCWGSGELGQNGADTGFLDAPALIAPAPGIAQ